MSRPVLSPGGPASLGIPVTIINPSNQEPHPPAKGKHLRGSPAKTILLAEDSPDDEFLFLELFRRCQISNRLMVVHNGKEAIAYLNREEPYSDAETYPMPSVLFLDLKMPQAGGFEVLRWIKTRPALQAMLTIILTHQSDVRDVSQVYELGARSFLIKPFTAAELHNIIQHFEAHFNDGGPSPLPPVFPPATSARPEAFRRVRITE